MSRVKSVPPVWILRVFTDLEGCHGNPLGVVVDTAEMGDTACQDIACRLGFSETVFVDDPALGICRIFTPSVSLPFAGHPMVGTAWLLGHLGAEPEMLRPPAGPVEYGKDGSDWWVEAQAEWCPPWRLHELPSSEAVESAVTPGADAHDQVWAWMDIDAGTVRARVFAESYGVPEDEATGSAAIPLAVALGRSLTITQGKGSRLLANPVGHGRARVGGRVVLDRQDRL